MINIKIINADLDEQDYQKLIHYLDANNFNYTQQNNGKPIVSGALPCSLCNGTGKQIPCYDVAKYYEDDGNDH